MVETPAQLKAGENSEHLKDADFVLIGDDYHRICAPLPGDPSKMRSCIFWTKDGPDDNSPSWEKVVSEFLYYVNINTET